MSDNRPTRYLDHDGTVVYRASGFGSCDGVILGLAAGRQPNPTPEWLQVVFDEGTRMEQPILDRLLALEPGHYNHLVLDTQTEWELEIGEINDRRIIIRGHSDGWDANSMTIVECKKFRDSTWPKFQRQAIECNPLYPWQVSVYMWAAAQQGYAPRLLFVGGHYDQSNDEITEIGVFEYPDPPIPLSAIRKRIARWENMIGEGLDVTDLTSPCTTPMFPCAMFGKGCPNETATEAITLDGEREQIAVTIAQEMEKQGRISRTAEETLRAAKERKKELEAGLRALHADLIESGVLPSAPKKMLAGGYTLTHVSSEVPEKVVKGYSLDYFKITAPKEGTTP
jgi:hypothetical protein